MNEKELWDYFLERKVFSQRKLDRDFIWVRKGDFQPVKRHFMSEFNLFHRGESMRSSGYFRHIHAVDQGEYIFLHHDMGNIARFLPLGLIHLFLDVVPHEIYARIKGPRESYYKPASMSIDKKPIDRI